MAKCKDCIWYGDCFSVGGCDDFSPVAPSHAEDEERYKKEFYEQWFEYIDEDS